MKYTIIFSIILVFFSCMRKNEELIVSKTDVASALTEAAINDSVDRKNEKNIRKINGVYKGVFPCMDCKGIQTTMVIKKNRIYYLKMKYLGSRKKGVLERGKFEWVGEDNNIRLKNKDKMEFRVGENRIWLVNSEDKEFLWQGNNSEYILDRE